MLRNEIDFSKGNIYQITNDDHNYVYIGYTCDTVPKTCVNRGRNVNVKTEIIIHLPINKKNWI